MKILNKILILIVVLAIIPLVVLASINSAVFKEFIINHHYSHQTSLAVTFNKLLSSTLDRFSVRVTDFSTDYLFIDGLRKGIEPNDTALSSNLSAHLAYKIALDPAIFHAGITNKNGIVIADTTFDEIGFNLSEIDYVKNAGITPIMTDIYFPLELEEKHHKTPTITISKAIIDHVTNEKIGVIFYQANATYIESMLKTSLNISKNRATADIDVYLVNKDKILITGSKHSNRILREKVDTPPVKACVDGGNDYVGTYENFAGIRVIGASTCIPANKWTLLIEQPEAEELVILKNFKLNLLIISLSIIIFAVVVGSLFYYFTIQTNVDKLNKYVEEISVGNVDAKHNVKSGDEFEDLANHFEKLKDILARYIKATVESKKIGNGNNDKKKQQEIKK